jgi:hypothetical protein
VCRSPTAAGSGLELAEIVHAFGDDYRAHHALCGQQDKALRAIAACRTAELGGHVEVCDRCGAVVHHYHSCRNRHCPKCQALAKERWVRARQGELLPGVEYFHVVFTLPHALNPLAQGRPALIYRLLFQATAETLLAFGRNPRWLGAELGFSAILHTWGQRLDQHLHLHCVVSGGGLTEAGEWKAAKPHFLFPVRALSRVFRGKYLEGLEGALHRGEVRLPDGATDEAAIAAFLAGLRASNWVVYAKPPFADAGQVVAYLGRYTHRVAIGNHRLVAMEDGQVRFRWRDYAHGNRNKVMALEGEEFLRRFLLHVLPKGFTRIRHYGFLASRGKRERLAAVRRALSVPEPEPLEVESVEAFLLRVVGIDIHRCPHCGAGRMRVVAEIAPQRRPPATGPPGGAR